MNSLLIPFGKSVVLHVLLGVVLVSSVHFASPPEMPSLNSSVQPIDAVVINETALAQQVQKLEAEKLRKKTAEEKRVSDLEKRAKAAQRKRQEEEKNLRDLSQKTKTQEAEKRKAEQATAAARKKQQQEKEKAIKLEADRKRKERERKAAEQKAEAAKRKAAQAKKQREAEEKALKEAERKKQEAREKAQREKALEEQLLAEQAVRNQRKQKQVIGEVDKYKVLIQQTITRHWIKDSSMMGKTCRLNIRLASNGLVTQVTVLSGDANVCRSAQAAVLKADTLPVSSDPDVFAELKNINLTLNP